MLKDLLESIEIDNAVEQKYINEINVIHSTWQGVSFLRDRANEINELTKNRINPDGKYKMMILPNDSMISDLPIWLLVNIYNWYSVSLVNMITAITKIWLSESIIRLEQRDDYINKVCEQEKIYRDKIGAHYSFTTKNRNDSDAERTASSFPVICFNGFIWIACPWRITVQSNGKETTNDNMKEWDINSSFLSIQKRYIEES